MNNRVFRSFSKSSKNISKIFFRPANISHLSFVNRIDADRKEAKEMTEKELEKIYNEAYRAVYWTAMQILKNEADAEDVVQDTFVSFMESYSNLEDTSKAVALLKKIAANKSLDRIKLSRTDDADDELLESVEAVPEDFLPDSIIESEDARRIVMDIINNALSDDIRRTLILFYFDEMSTKEIAEALGVPEGTVRRRLNFARNKIKKEVEKYEKENNTKLFGMATLPFLSKLFMKEAEQVPFKAMSASLTTLSASAEASTHGAGIKVAASAAKKGTGMMINKGLIIGISSAVAVGTAVAVTVAVLSKKPDTEPEKTRRTTVEETTDRVIATTTEETTTEATTAETSETSQTEDNKPQPYSIEGMSADEVADHLYMLRQIKNGDPASAYPDRFKAVPRNMDANKHVYLFKSAGYTNLIDSIAVNNVDEDNGSFVLNPDSTVTVKLETTDKEFADALYKRLKETMVEYSQGDINGVGVSDDSEEGRDTWHCTYSIKVEVSESEKHDMATSKGGEKHFYRLVNCTISRVKFDGEYHFTVRMPVNR